MVLAAKEIRCEIGIRDLLHSFLIVGVILSILSDLLHDLFVTCELEHNVFDDVSIVCACSSADPCAAPVVRLRAVANCIVAIDTVADFLFAALVYRSLKRVAKQCEVDAPC